MATFTGRKQELDNLHSRIQRNTETITVISQMTSISGLGGIGKTELARQYILDRGNENYDNNVIWINAGSEVSLIESFYRLATEKLKIRMKDINGKEKQIETIVKEVYEYFYKKKCLFVFDNAEKSEYFKKFLPIRCLTLDTGKPYILITSRDREWENGIEVMDLSNLDFKDAITLVKKGLGIPEDETSQDEEIQNLIEKMQMFPLAIQQAIAYIADQRVTENFSINDYLQEYEEKTKDLLDSELFRGIDNEYEKTTFTTWQITVDKISNKQYGQLALKIFNTMALLAPNNIPREMFLPLVKEDKTLKSAVRLLARYSMINGERQQSSLNVHSLVQEVTNIHLENQNLMEQTVHEALTLIPEFPPYPMNEGSSLRQQSLLPHLESLLSHIDKWVAKHPLKEKQTDQDILPLLETMSDGYMDLSVYRRVKQLLQRALSIAEKRFMVETMFALLIQ